VIYSYQNVKKNFGLEWEKLDQNEKRVIANFIFESYKLETFEKGF